LEPTRMGDLDTDETHDLRNRFGVGEWSGALGDLGILLPLALALVVANGFPFGRMLFLWGVVYVFTGWFYRVPVSVQPLKAMAVIAIAGGLPPELLSSTAFFFGGLMVVLSLTGALRWLGRWFSPALIRGVQLGIGLILARRALQLLLDNGLVLHAGSASTTVNVLFTAGAGVALILFVVWKRMTFALPLIIVGTAAVSFFAGPSAPEIQTGALFALGLPDVSFLLTGLVLLVIPQLPLTLGNAVFAASDASHNLWGERARRVTPTRLGLSIGFGNMVIGLLGGFPMCHGAGGMAAHAQFGGRTGGTTIITGSILIACALIGPAAAFLRAVPVSVLAAVLLLVSWRMMALALQLEAKVDVAVAVLVGGISFLTGNLAIALGAGLVSVWGIALSRGRVATKIERSDG